MTTKCPPAFSFGQSQRSKSIRQPNTLLVFSASSDKNQSPGPDKYRLEGNLTERFKRSPAYFIGKANRDPNS